ncbi:transcriptional regulator, AraC family [Stackebrandtia nassauensis DSM 44728]|uniref:Transcriptional regulator, AraC family n=1 Tax=Stackebrandtia nassauensis (strain DSM 44728 / CIP 108903 / NRRL B-16338 / NBRC 102104 / LLR-40K-21) TaxID=446470 RepID=D3PWV1_STANL|nr:transcriptional regulator, AraC family [Stackebrandtia nassauensis DSM 44728]
MFLTHPPSALIDGSPRLRLRSPPTYWRCEPSWVWQARPLTDHLLWHVHDGAGELRLDDRHVRLRPGFCAVFAPGDAPVATHDPRHPLLVFGMHFTATGFDGDLVPEQRWCRLWDQEFAVRLARHCDYAHRRGDDLGQRQAVLGLEQFLCLLWDNVTRPAPGPGDAAVEDIARAVRQEPSRDWTVATLAKRANLSRAQFTRRFTAHTGYSPARYVIRARLDRARQLLTETNMSVGQVAATLGYPDVGYFSRQYKVHTGSSPSRDRGGGETSVDWLMRVPTVPLSPNIQGRSDYRSRSVITEYQAPNGFATIPRQRSLREHPLIAALLSLELDPRDYVIFGSGPLLAHGLRADVADLDVVARGRAWHRALRMSGYSIDLGPHSFELMLRFFGGGVEISAYWTDTSWDVDALIDTAEIIDGLRFAALRDVLEYKRTLDRAKDRADVAALERHLSTAEELEPVLCAA